MKRRGRGSLRICRQPGQREAGAKAEGLDGGAAASRGSARKTVQKSNERLQILFDCVSHLLAERDKAKIIPDIFQRVAAHVGADAFFNYLRVPETCGYDLFGLAEITSDAVCDICESCSGGALHCLAARNRAMVVANDIQRSEDPDLSEVRATGVQACVCIPLLVGGELLGVLSFASRSRPKFAPDELEFLQLIAGLAAGAINRARSEELLRDRDQRLETALELAKMGSWEIDLGGIPHATVSDQELIKAFDCGRLSPELQKMVGLAPGEYRSFSDWEKRIHPEDRPRAFEMLRSAIHNDRSYDCEHRFVWPDGTVHWLHCRGMLFRDKTGARQRFMGVSIDITESKQAEEEIRRRNERLQFMSNCLAQLLAERDPDRIAANLFYGASLHVGADACLNYHVNGEKPEIVLHVSHGLSEQARRRVERLRFGEGPCGVVAQSRSVLIAADIQHTSDPDVELARELGFQCYAGFPLIAGDRLLGTLDFAATDKTAFTVEERDFLQLIAAYMAMALQRAQAEREVVQSKETAEYANHAKALFIASLSHELRTPLTPALMTVTSLEHDDTLAPAVREQIGIVRRSIELESRLIDDLLDLTRIERGKFSLRIENVDVGELLRRAMEIVREDLLLKQLNFKIDVTAGQTLTRGDPARLQQVFWNLLNNAIKFTPLGGSIRIRIFNPDPGSLGVEIRDSGIGITPEDLGKIFDPFEQCAIAGNRRYGGLGLGLAISKSIVDLHGGAISVASEGVSRGSTFSVRLPIIETPAMAPSRPERVSRERPSEHLHILLVEDHEQTRAVLARLLRRDGHEVQTAPSCAAAIQAAHSTPEFHKFEVLISDIGLPDDSGLNLVRQLKAEAPKLTAIALSGYGTREDIDKSIQAGFDAHLIKPIGIEELRRALAA